MHPIGFPYQAYISRVRS